MPPELEGVLRACADLIAEAAGRRPAAVRLGPSAVRPDWREAVFAAPPGGPGPHVLGRAVFRPAGFGRAAVCLETPAACEIDVRLPARALPEGPLWLRLD